MGNFNKKYDATVKVTNPRQDFLQKEKEQKPNYSYLLLVVILISKEGITGFSKI